VNQTERQQTKMSRSMPKATSRLLILVICNVAFFFSSPLVLLTKYRTMYFF